MALTTAKEMSVAILDPQFRRWDDRTRSTRSLCARELINEGARHLTRNTAGYDRVDGLVAIRLAA